MSALRLISPQASSSDRSDLPARLLSAREVAEFMGVNVRTVRRWTSEGRLVPIRLSTGTIRFAPSAIEGLIADDPINVNDGAKTTAPSLETSPGGQAQHAPA